MPQKPDRFERMAANLPIAYSGTCSVGDVAKLLRKEHRWVEQTIRKYIIAIQKERKAFTADYADGCVDVGKDLLNMLKQRRK